MKLQHIITAIALFVGAGMFTSIQAYKGYIINATPKIIEVDVVLKSLICPDEKGRKIDPGATYEFDTGAICLVKSIDATVYHGSRPDEHVKPPAYTSVGGNAGGTWVVYGPYSGNQYGIFRK